MDSNNTELGEKLSLEYDIALDKVRAALESQYYRSGIDFLLTPDEIWLTEKAINALNWNPKVTFLWKKFIEVSTALDKFNGY